MVKIRDQITRNQYRFIVSHVQMTDSLGRQMDGVVWPQGGANESSAHSELIRGSVDVRFTYRCFLFSNLSRGIKLKTKLRSVGFVITRHVSLKWIYIFLFIRSDEKKLNLLGKCGET